MENINFYQGWLTSSLFWLGACISIFGLFLLLVPAYAINLSHKLNRWFSTDAFFQSLDKPHFQERFFYRWHRPFGIILILAPIYILYMLLIRTDLNNIAALMPVFDEPVINEWLYEALGFFLVAVNVLIAIIGVAVFVRPSMLKKLEEKANIWYQTDKPLQKLDASYDIPEKILPGNVRLFGTLVLLGGIYIMTSTAYLVF